MSVKIPWSLGIMEELQERGTLTPDFENFNKAVEIPLFIYDDYKLGQWNDSFFKEGVNYYGEGITSNQNFVMKRTEGDSCLVFENQKDEPKGRVKGDVFGVAPETILVLDKLMDHTIKTYRQKIFIMLEDQPEAVGKWQPSYKGRPYLKCWMYLFNPLWYSFRPIKTSIVGKTARIPPKTDDEIIYAYDFKERRRPIQYERAIPHGWNGWHDGDGWPDEDYRELALGI